VNESAEKMLAGTSASYEEAVVGADGLFGGSFSQRSSPLLVPSPAGTPAPREQMIGTALEVHLSNITVIGQRGEKSERQSSMRFLTRVALTARLFRSADGHFCAVTAIPDSSPGCNGEALRAMRLDFVPRTAVDVVPQPQVEVGCGRPEKAEDPAVRDQPYCAEPEGMCRTGDRG
jgi:hypothetical protein